MPRALPVALALLTFAAASRVPAWARREPAKWSAGLAIEEAYTDNVQADTGRRREDDAFTTFTARVEWQRRGEWWFPSELAGTVQGRVYGKSSDFDTSEIRQEVTYAVARTDVLLRYGFIPRRLLFAGEDSVGPRDQPFYKEHALAAGLGRRFGREKRLRVRALFAADWDDFFAPDSDRDSFTHGFVGDLRYFLFPSFAPMVGGEYVTRDARRANNDRDEASMGTGFDASLPYGLALRFRYERSSRNYTVSKERDADGHRNSNFGRKELIDELQTSLTAPVPQIDGVALRLRYRFRTGDRDRPKREGFVPDPIGDVNEVGFEVSYVFD